jgi:hypothetical protein
MCVRTFPRLHIFCVSVIQEEPRAVVKVAVEGMLELRIADQVTLTHVPRQATDASDTFGQIILEWYSSPQADCTADAVVAVLLQQQGKPAAIGAAEEERKCDPLPPQMCS